MDRFVLTHCDRYVAALKQTRETQGPCRASAAFPPLYFLLGRYVINDYVLCCKFSISAQCQCSHSHLCFLRSGVFVSELPKLVYLFRVSLS